MTDNQNPADKTYDAFATLARQRIHSLDEGLRTPCANPAEWSTTRDRLAAFAQEIAGEGSRFGYPLMTQIGRSLGDLLMASSAADPRGLRLAVTHVAALRTVLENDIKGHGGAAGAALLARLQGLSQKAS